MDRRGFMAGILAACAAPAIVRADSLMKCTGIVIPTTAEVIIVSGMRTVLTAQQIITRALKMIDEQNAAHPYLAHQYDDGFKILNAMLS